MELEQTHARFRTTSWTKIRALGQGTDDERAEALSALTVRYWPAVYAFLRGKGLEPEAASELTQDFFVQVVFGRRLFAKADAARGRLRNLILKALRNFRMDRARAEAARGGAATISLDDLRREESRLGCSMAADVDTLFERRWAMGLVEETYRRCEAYFRSAGKTGHWSIFFRHELHPALNATSPPRLEAICSEAGFDTPSQAASAKKEVRRRLRVLLREVVAETLDEPAELEDELARIRQVLFTADDVADGSGAGGG